MGEGWRCVGAGEGWSGQECWAVLRQDGGEGCEVGWDEKEWNENGEMGVRMDSKYEKGLKNILSTL